MRGKKIRRSSRSIYCLAKHTRSNLRQLKPEENGNLAVRAHIPLKARSAENLEKDSRKSKAEIT